MSVQQDCIWVAPETTAEELGTYEQPLSDIGSAAATARPGQHIVLKPGVYAGDVTIQQSGLRDMPLHIRPETPGTAVISGACWYLYDVSDLIVSGLEFRDSPAIAISVVGACCRNAFSELLFTNCSLRKRPSCTMFFGGSGSRDNMIERCVFRHAETDTEEHISTAQASAALVFVQGDSDGEAANTSFSILGNTFVNYGFGVLAGTRDDSSGLYGHLIECNVFEGCRGDGIVVKCGDTTVRANVFAGVGRSAVNLATGRASLVEHNRMVDCGNGCSVAGDGHTISGNCIMRSRREAIRIGAGSGLDEPGAATVLVERNSLFDCAAGAAAVESTAGANCVLERNLFSGSSLPYRPEQTSGAIPTIFAVDNASTGDTAGLVGCSHEHIVFPGRDRDDFTSNSAFGASGWPLTPELPRLEPSEYVGPGDLDEEDEPVEPVVERVVDDVDRNQLLAQGLFFEED